PLTRVGSGRSDRAAGLRFSRIGTEALPIDLEVAAQLADAGGREAVALADVLGAFADHEVVDQMLIALGTGSPPGRKVGAKGDLLGHGTLGVVVQRLVKDVPLLAARGGEGTDRETAAPLGHRRQDVPGLLLAAEATAAFHGPRRE